MIAGMAIDVVCPKCVLFSIFCTEELHLVKKAHIMRIYCKQLFGKCFLNFQKCVLIYKYPSCSVQLYYIKNSLHFQYPFGEILLKLFAYKKVHLFVNA